MTFDEAIEYLNSKNLRAKPRDWNIGHSIQVYAGLMDSQPPIIAFSHCAYIVPQDDGTAWVYGEVGRPILFDSTELACDHVIDLFKDVKDVGQN